MSSASALQGSPQGNVYGAQRQPPGYSRDRSQRASTSSPLSSHDYRPSTKVEQEQTRHSGYAETYQSNATPSPQARYATHHVYTSSPSPLARRSESRQSESRQSESRQSESRQSNYSQTSTLSSFSRNNDRLPAPESVHSSSDSHASHSRATTPKPRDFQDNGDSSFTSSEDEEEHSTTPRSEMKRWTPSNVGARGNARYSSEPPPESSSMTPVRQGTYRTSHRPLDDCGGYDLDSGGKVEAWRGAGETGQNGGSSRRRSALPAEFTNHVVSPDKGTLATFSLILTPSDKSAEVTHVDVSL
jgi:hypothetical protein